jgi:hypothetical protein
MGIRPFQEGTKTAAKFGKLILQGISDCKAEKISSDRLIKSLQRNVTFSLEHLAIYETIL